MNKYVRGLLAGGLMGLAAAGTIMAVGRRRRMRMMRRDARSRARRTIRAVKKNALRLGSALKSGTVAFASRLAEKGNWGRT